METAGWKPVALIGLTLATLAGCSEAERAAEERGKAGAEVVRAPIQTEMKTILRDIRIGQERARSTGGEYVSWSELQRDFLNRAVPGAYRVDLSNVSPTGYRAEVVHERSGLRCELEEGADRSRGPICR